MISTERVLQIRPEALLEATDVAVALRSAGAHDFDRDDESLSTVDEVDRIYRHPIVAGFPLSADTRFGEELRGAFRAMLYEAKAAELSLSVPGDMLPMSFVTMLRVEPFELGDVELERIVKALVREFGADLTVRPRLMGERGTVWQDVIRFLLDGPVPLSWLMNRADASPATIEWMSDIQDQELGWQFDRFASYLYEGTLAPILSGSRRQDVPVGVEGLS